MTTATTELLTPRQVADRLKVHTDTLEQWRGRRTGPPWIKLGDAQQSPVRYPADQFEIYLRERANKD